ncbi:hypothetical protein AGRA3207_002668 [Actinomadura graeca]|uniref:Bacterial transcriptional activator domain-containing protein n=1 Tax=Actinomadura graeca TaxID=2750812 RepID=A0ABX8QSS8_9ACTN|nr:bacterial transcriptional activator domain-containing protein [Actinomadura graeca]QXJ21780.1 hypothetical protein AGRA3207_002668 [Actinomadura graeca]
MDDEETDEPGASGGARVEVLPSFRCHLGGREVRLSRALSSLVVTVALEPRGLTREGLPARLWPDVDPPDASKRLRQALWRIRRETGDRLLEVTPDLVALRGEVTVDLRRGERLARRVIKGDVPAGWSGTGMLGRQMLPGWQEEEVCAARDRWDRLRLLALEGLAEHTLASGDVPAAIELAEAATRVDELSEAPHRLAAAAHLTRGDHVSAWRVFLRYRRLLAEAIGLEPSSGFRDLVERVRPDSLRFG